MQEIRPRLFFDFVFSSFCFFHPRCKQNFVVVFVSFFLELESIETRKFKIVKIRGIYPRCKQNFVLVFVSFFLELESIETRNFKIVNIFYNIFKIMKNRRGRKG